MLDDIEDRSPLRRGRPSTHLIYGQSQTINSATYILLRAIGEVVGFGNKTSTEILLEELNNLFLGQSLDLYWKFHIGRPSTAEYMCMIDNKTGAMFRLIARLMQAENENSKSRHADVLSFVTLLGRYFQIRDDFQNLQSNEYGNQKGFCEDLDEGKMSLPLVHALQTEPSIRAELMGILRQKTSKGLSSQMKEHVLGRFGEAGSLSYTHDVLEGMEKSLTQSLRKLETDFGIENPMLEVLLSRLKI